MTCPTCRTAWKILRLFNPRAKEVQTYWVCKCEGQLPEVNHGR